MKLKLIHWGLILVSVPLVFSLAFVVTLSAALKEAETEARLASQSNKLTTEATNLNKLLLDGTTALVAYKYTHMSTWLTKYDEITPQIKPIVDNLNKLTDPGTRQRRRADNLAYATQQLMKLEDTWRNPEESGVYYLKDSHAFQEDGKKRYNEFFREFKALVDEEKEEQAKHPLAEEQTRERVRQVLIGFLALNALVTVLMAIFFSKKISSRLDVLSQNAHLLAKRQPLHKPIGGVDEVADLDRVFHEMADALIKAERRKQDFVSMISHDLRTPLCSLQTTLALINRGVYGQINEKGQDRVSDAEKESDRLISLINELLDIDRIEAGMLELNKSQFDLSGTVKRAVNAMESMAEKRNIAIKYTPEELNVEADEDRLMQVLVNLISNAIKYSGDNTEITITVARENDSVKVVVADQGRGIPKEFIAKIFEPFQQLGSSEDGTPSSGLGLAITKAVIAAHKGNIGVESEVGAGSKFWFAIPA